LGPWLPPLSRFLILHQVTLLLFCLKFECHVSSPYDEMNPSGSNINPCIDIS
jgi:hypothetical protein